MNFTEVVIYTNTAGIEPLTGRLLMEGIKGFVIEDPQDFNEFLESTTPHWDYVDESLAVLQEGETKVKLYLPDNAQGAEQLSAVRQVLAAMSETGEDYGRLAYECTGVREEDWANNWKKYFKPFPVGERFYIKPSWEELEDAQGRIILQIDPASSFGTGTHATTRLCMSFLEKQVKPGAKVLDMGCGSGILSVAALQLGADHVTAVDIDQNAVVTTGENIERNGIAPEKIKALCGNVLTDEEFSLSLGSDCYDVIAANIVADVLIAMAQTLRRMIRKEGSLVVSGIISERADEVVDALEAAGFAAVAKHEEEDWAAVLLRVQV